MQYRILGSTGWKISAIGLGTWNIGGQWGPVSREDALATVGAADAYGEPPGLSEELLGEALRGRRANLYIATKVGNYARRSGHPLAFDTPDHVRLCCDASLGRMKIDTIDLYQCHMGDLEEPGVFLEAFDRLKAAGKIRAFGVSTNSLKVAQAFDSGGGLAAVQVNYSLLGRGAEKNLLPWCRERNIGVLVRGPLAKGILAGKYGRDSRFGDSVRSGWNDKNRKEYLAMVEKVETLRFLEAKGRTMAQAALAWILSNPAITCPIPGAKSPDQARANAAAADVNLAPEEIAKANQITA
jgi:aryl-alcohol dehydrogenase-like predicted oxidoreductase